MDLACTSEYSFQGGTFYHRTFGRAPRRVSRVCAEGRVSHVACFQTYSWSGVFQAFSCRESFVLCEKGFLLLERQHKDIPVHIIHTRHMCMPQFKVHSVGHYDLRCVPRERGVPCAARVRCVPCVTRGVLSNLCF